MRIGVGTFVSVLACVMGVAACGGPSDSSSTTPATPGSSSSPAASTSPSASPTPTSASPTSTTAAPDVGTTPTSGQWQFTFEGAQLTCLGDYPLAAGGPFTMSANDSVATWNIDGQVLGFSASGGPVNMYSTATRLFPVQTPTGGTSAGTVSFDFVANTADTGVGTLHWNNGIDCSGDYPFTMVLVTPAAGTPPPSSLIVPGQWNVQVDSPLTSDCGDGVVLDDFGGFWDLPLNEPVTLEEGTPGPDGSTSFVFVPPGDIVMASSPGDATFVQVGGPVSVGEPITMSGGDINLDFSGSDFAVQWELTAETPESMTGTVFFTDGVCAGYAEVSMSHT